MNAPRLSLLTMFDPLNSPSSPMQNSSQLRESNKENEEHGQDRLTLTAFFNKTYKRQHVSEKMPSLCDYNGKLVDVGDISVVRERTEDTDRQVYGASAENSEDPLVTYESGPTPGDVGTSGMPHLAHEDATSNPRKPLASIIVADSFVHHDHATEHSYQTPTAPFFQIPALQTTSDTPVSAILQPTGVRDLSSSDLNPTQTTSDVSLHAGESARDISSLASSTAFLIPSSTTHLLVNASLSSLAPSVSTSSTNSSLYPAPHHGTPKSRRRNAPTPGSNSSNRMSLDLHTSFNMHLQGDSSFDLLNDRISFLGDSSSEASEDDIDVEAEEKAMEAIISEKERSDCSGNDGIREELIITPETQPNCDQAALDNLSDVHTPPTPVTPQALSKFSSTTPEDKKISGTTGSQESTPQPSGKALKRRTLPADSSPSSSKEHGSSADKEEQYGTPIAQTKPRRLSRAGVLSPSATTTAAPLKPVPALRIIKRTETAKGHSTTESIGRRSPEEVPEESKRSVVAPTAAPMSRMARRPSVVATAAPTPPAAVVAPSQPKTIVKGLQRPAPGSKFTLPSTNKTTSATASTQSSLSRAKSVTGLMRTAGVQRPPVAPRPAAEPKKFAQSRAPLETTGGASGSSRLQRQPSVTRAVGSGLRAPSQSMQKLSDGTGPGTRLPMPKSVSMASKLPSFGGRSKIATRTS